MECKNHHLKMFSVVITEGRGVGGGGKGYKGDIGNKRYNKK